MGKATAKVEGVDVCPAHYIIYVRRGKQDDESMQLQGVKLPPPRTGNGVKLGEKDLERTFGLPEGVEPVGKVGGHYDTKAMQADRDAGMKPKEIAAKHEVSLTTVYTVTLDHRKSKEPKDRNKNRNNIHTETTMETLAHNAVDWSDVLADLRAKRAKLDAAIEAVEELFLGHA
jgi:hypothetical protein